MRSLLAFLLAFLAGCATTPPPPPERAPDPPAADAPAATKTATPVERTYRSALPICYDAALKLCRDRDYRVMSQQPSASLSAHARTFDFTLSFARTPENRTRVTMRATSPEATRFLDQLCDTLLEPRQ